MFLFQRVTWKWRTKGMKMWSGTCHRLRHPMWKWVNAAVVALHRSLGVSPSLCLLLSFSLHPFKIENTFEHNLSYNDTFCLCLYQGNALLLFFISNVLPDCESISALWDNSWFASWLTESACAHPVSSPRVHWVIKRMGKLGVPPGSQTPDFPCFETRAAGIMPYVVSLEVI